MKKEKAENKYQDAVASGNFATKMQESKEDKDMLEIELGNI